MKETENEFLISNFFLWPFRVECFLDVCIVAGDLRSRIQGAGGLVTFILTSGACLSIQEASKVSKVSKLLSASSVA